jgi:hypothetical protein
MRSPFAKLAAEHHQMTTLVRATLWLSFPFNLIAAWMLMRPASAFGQFVGVPTDVPSLYSLVVGFLICEFGVTYAWLALQKHIHRPLLAFCAIGKSGVFGIVLLLWLGAAVSGRLLLMASGDLMLAIIWFWWLFNSRE